MSHLLWLDEALLKRIQYLCPKPRGIARVDDRRVLSGIIHAFRNGLRGLIDRHAMTLADAMRWSLPGAGPHLRSFSASYNSDLTDAGVAALARISPNTMTELGFVGCGIGDTGGLALLDWARRASQPRMICIEQNDFSAELRHEFAKLRDYHAGLIVIT